MTMAATKMARQPERKSVPRELKRPTKREAKALGESGAFALHLWSILDDKGWSKDDLLTALEQLGIEDHAVRSWLRGESMPRSKELRNIGKAIGLADSRHILPPDRL